MPQHSASSHAWVYASKALSYARTNCPSIHPFHLLTPAGDHPAGLPGLRHRHPQRSHPRLTAQLHSSVTRTAAVGHGRTPGPPPHPPRTPGPPSHALKPILTLPKATTRRSPGKQRRHHRWQQHHRQQRTQATPTSLRQREQQRPCTFHYSEPKPRCRWEFGLCSCSSSSSGSRQWPAWT